MLKQTTCILLVVFLINVTSGFERWYKTNGVASLACPLDDNPDDPTVLPFQGDCSKFLKCSYGLAYTLSCPRGLHWSTILARCESPFVAQCDSTATTAKPITGGNGCAFAYKPHPYDCSKAIQCASGVEFEISCPDGASWDRISNKCLFVGAVC